MKPYNFYKIKDDKVFLKVVNKHYGKFIQAYVQTEAADRDKVRQTFYGNYPYANRVRFNRIVAPKGFGAFTV